MTSETETFCTVFDCMDGRCQGPTAVWCRNHLKARFPDTITLPGMDKMLASAPDDDHLMEYIRDTMAKISVDGHGSRIAVIVGHSGCAGNPVSNDEHREHIRRAVERVGSWGLFESVFGLFEPVNETPDCKPQIISSWDASDNVTAAA